MKNEDLPQESDSSEEVFSTEEIIEKLRELSDAGIDFTNEDVEHVRAMLPDEAMEYLIVALEENGIDPEPVLQREFYIEGEMEENSDEVKKIQQGRFRESGQVYRSEEVDKLL